MDASVTWVVLVLMLLVAALSVASSRFRVTRPVLMLAAGIAIAFFPAWPALTLDPELVLTVLLPPLLYSSGVNMSWRSFRSYLRPILLLAIGFVVFTAVAVAAVVHYAFGFPWPVGLVLGAIVSPPDAVAPAAVLRSLGVPAGPSRCSRARVSSTMIERELDLEEAQLRHLIANAGTRNAVTQEG